jgi:autotransporter passenger strand-loop-strand repeat protein
LNGGSEVLDTAATDLSGTVESGGVLIVSGGKAVATDVRSGGRLIAASGGSALGLLVGSGAILDVASGAVISGLTAASGAILALAPGEVVSGALLGGGAIIDTGLGYVVSGGVLSALSSLPAPLTLVGAGVSAFVDSGLAADLTVGSGGLLSLGSGTGGSELSISGGALVLNSAATVNDTISFQGSGGTLVLNNTTPVTLAGFGTGAAETVVLSGLPFSSGATLSSIGSELLVSDGGISATVTLAGLATAAQVQLGDLGGVLELSAACFAAGTRILTLSGEVAVEDLAPGDIVVTVREGGPSSRPVVWTGRRATHIGRHPNPEQVRPVRILAGAFGQGVPERDLRVSPNHAIYIDGALFEAISLVNGISIVQETATRFVTYHHIELDAHDIIVAEGLATESYLDTGNRDMFENSEGAVRLFPDFRTAADAPTCVTLHRAGPAVARVHAALEVLALGFLARRA